MTQIPLLDKGYIRLVDHMGSDLSVVRAARVSYNNDVVPENSTLAREEKLIKYLWQNKHTTPFESCAITFEIKAPIFVFRQWHRHRTQSYNEISARYTELIDEYYVPQAIHIGQQDTKNRQGRALGDDMNMVGNIKDEIRSYEYTCQNSFVQYKILLDNGWPRELARMCLPVSTYSRMYSTGNLLNWLKFTFLRSDEHAQYEIRVYSDAILNVLRTLYPMVMKAYDGEANDL